MNKRYAVASLTLSAAAFVSLLVSEGYTDKAIIPVKGDVPTYGFGTTDGVKIGDRTDPVTSVKLALRDVTKFEGAIKQCVKVPLSQIEYDVWLKFTYNIGASAFCKSTAVKLLNDGQYKAACDQMLRWVFVGPNKIQGLVNRRQKEHALCISGLQSQ
jgi:lysozyme